MPLKRNTICVTVPYTEPSLLSVNHIYESLCSVWTTHRKHVYQGADKSLAQPTSQCILFGKNISFDASLVIYINSTNIPPIAIINRVYEHKNLLSL
jgi:hypothetical protein